MGKDQVIQAIDRGRGTSLMIFLLFLSGFFLIFLLAVRLFFKNDVRLAEYINDFRNLFDAQPTVYLMFSLLCISIGLAAYLLSYISIALPAYLFQKLFFRFREKDKKEMRKLYGKLRPKALDKSLHKAKATFLIRLIHHGGPVSRDIRFLFTQVMFARTALFSTTLFLGVISWYDDAMNFVWVVGAYFFSIVAYGAGGILFDRSLVTANYQLSEKPDITF